MHAANYPVPFYIQLNYPIDLLQKDRPLPTHVQCRNTFPSVHSVLRKLAPFAFLTSTVAHREREKNGYLRRLKDRKLPKQLRNC